jgi:hypothetical protein
MGALPNLLPRSLLAERSRRRRIHQWFVVATVELTLLTGACVLLRVDTGDAVAGMDTTIRSTVGQIDLMAAAIAESRRELADLERRMAITNEVDRQPDWSIILAMVSKKGSGSIRLESCQLLPGVQTAEGRVEYKFTILGRCVSQADLTRFVESLEQTGAFSRIKIVETRRVPESTAVRFTVESALMEGGGS